MKITTYRAEATGVTWFAIENRRYITPWCMSLFDAIGCWIKVEEYKKKMTAICLRKGERRPSPFCKGRSRAEKGLWMQKV